MHESQSAAAVLMVRPACFGFNPQTAASNVFQHDTSGQYDADDPPDVDGRHNADGPLVADDPPDADDPQSAALAEFDAVAAALRHAGIEVLIAADTELPPKPDAIFPNNWVSFHRDGTIALFPLLAANRRAERREDILAFVAREGGFRVERTVDFTHHETEGRYLEGTGSLVLDRAHRVAYACASPRTHPAALADFGRRLAYEVVSFDAADEAGRPIYHTNVMMAVGSRFAILCGECLGAAQRAVVTAKLHATGHEIVDITRSQMRHFAGNALELTSPRGPLLVLSSAAAAKLNAAQLERLGSHATLLPVTLPHIEKVGGGGVRCMLAEIHLPKS